MEAFRLNPASCSLAPETSEGFGAPDPCIFIYHIGGESRVLENGFTRDTIVSHDVHLATKATALFSTVQSSDAEYSCLICHQFD